MNVKKRIVFGLVILFLASCSATKKTSRKCDGKRGVRTNMGTM